MNSKVFKSAGGCAPTIGILGAVLSLIHVMENLNDPSKLGAGIAVAFVATVYGVGSANLLFLPVATKMEMRHRRDMIIKDSASVPPALRHRKANRKSRLPCPRRVREGCPVRG